ncbi:MAG: FRG domain-containing protein [Clostridia bacterium]|nr:FRG domain-containing protein [Clostridia bacterium]
MRIETINTIDELLNFITELSLKHGQRLWFRGVANKEWDLIPSIQRSSDRMASERFITNDFYIKAKQVMKYAPDKKNYSAWMSIMQHFGLPTRLLDWSSSPLVATFFAVEEYKKYPQADACVWVLAPGLLNKAEGFGDCIYPVDAVTAQNMLLPAFKERGQVIELEDKILACHSTENNLRMYSQQANFTIHNSQKRLTSICDSDTLYKIIIPSKERGRLLYNLEIFGITESFIYPDLDHISNDLKRAYRI